MFVIEVIPLKRGVHIESLSYFSSVAYPRGTIISIPLRNKEASGIVIDSKEVSGAKAALRAATFSLRKLPTQEDTKALSPAFIETAYELADLYAASPGAVMYQLLPPAVREGEVPLPHTHESTNETPDAPQVLQATTDERFLAYRSLVRETFAHAGSVLLVVPTAAQAVDAKERLSKGIQDRVIVLSTALTKKQREKAYAALEDFCKPKLIIATSSYAMLERHDITTVVIENAYSHNYRDRTRPYLDTRQVLKIHARESKRQLILGDILPRTEEEIFRRDETYATFGEHAKRLSLPGKLVVVEMKDKPHGDTPFTLFSRKALNAIRRTLDEKGHVFLFAPRRGIAPVVACLDCGFIFRDPESGAPYSLLEQGGKRWFVSGVSGTRVRAADTCPECTGWRLKERGIGIQHIHKELSALLPDVPITLFDHTSANTFKKANFLIDTFYKKKGSIMIGTPMVFPYLREPVDTSIIVNTDALRATPTWRVQEEILWTLLFLREKTNGTVLVQTRMEPDELIESARTGSVDSFYTEEQALRKQFKYPPYAHFIHLTWQGTRAQTEQIRTQIEAEFIMYEPLLYKAPTFGKNVTEYALIRRPTKDWPDSRLLALLRNLPPSVRIVMNPDRIV
ncbi:hypothetical protein KTR10_03215 [Candidatus Kaiserbacteria bacterium]|nr:hypothetical protein [Candidatus Kaiserbacteria bacterium]